LGCLTAISQSFLKEDLNISREQLSRFINWNSRIPVVMGTVTYTIPLSPPRHRMVSRIAFVVGSKSAPIKADNRRMYTDQNTL
jgi:hypothetical protein